MSFALFFVFLAPVKSGWYLAIGLLRPLDLGCCRRNCHQQSCPLCLAQREWSDVEATTSVALIINTHRRGDSATWQRQKPEEKNRSEQPDDRTSKCWCLRKNHRSLVDFDFLFLD